MKKILLVLLFLISGCSLKNDEVINPDINSNLLITQEQTISNLTFKNVSLSYQNGISTFIVDVTNNTEQIVSINEFKIVFKNQNGKEITTLKGNISNIVESNQTIQIVVTSDIDLSEANSLEYIIK